MTKSNRYFQASQSRSFANGPSWRTNVCHAFPRERLTTLDTQFCLDALKEARARAGCWPEIVNADQGCQYTRNAWVSLLEEAGVQLSMDGRGQWIDNVFVERLWRSLKYEDVYLHEYRDLVHLQHSVGTWLNFYNQERRHKALEYKTPWQVWLEESALAA